MSMKPTLIAYAVKDRGEDKKAFWTRIGAAWPLKERAGYTIELDAVPVDGRIVLIEPNGEEETNAKQKG
ncbi:hypothetical protein QWJ07_26480 [Frankia sp. RB7]|jgi:hypothetical protein|nr:hypothetical protein [Frankia sp. RB7]